MREIIITTESGSDLPEHLIKKHNIYIVPMYVSMDGEIYADRTIPVERIFNYYSRTSKIPSTCAANTFDYVNTFKQVRREHPDCVIFHLAYSAITTSSFQNGLIAAKQFKDVYFVDSKNVSGGLTAYIVKAIKLIEQKRDSLDDSPESYAQLVKELEALRSKIHFSFMPGNLNFLKAGGRLSNAAYLGATLLRVKPLIEMIDGKVTATKKYIGSMERSIPKFIKDFATEHNISKKALYIVTTERFPERARKLLHRTTEKLGFKHHEINTAGLVITCHSGPDSVGIAGWEADLDCD